MDAIFDSRPTLDQPDDDPHLWLEAIDSPEVLAWVDARNAETLSRYGGAAFMRDRDIVLDLLDRPDRIPTVQRYGDLVYNYWTDAEHPRGLWRRTTEAGYRTGTPTWQVLLDLDALAWTEGEDWVWAGATILPRTHDRALLRLSRGGSDASVLREFDLCNVAFVEDGFTLPEAKGEAVWLDRDTLLLSSAFGPNMATRSGYARTVRLWPRGCNPLDAAVLFETEPANLSVGGWADHQTGTERLTFVECTSFFDATIHLGDRSGPRARLDLPSHVNVNLHQNWLSLRLRQPWTIDASRYQPDTVLVIALTDFLAGGRNFTVLWKPGERQALQYVFWSAGRLILYILNDLRPMHLVCELQEDGWAQWTLPGLPALGSVDIWPLDGYSEEADGTLLATAHDPLTPPTLFKFPPALSAPCVLRQSPTLFDVRGLRVSRHEAISADGTRVPYVQVGPATLAGDAPVHLTAYGGFRHTLLPTYQPVLGRLWLERGGTCVTANIRGGGEFGTSWHDAGRREGKARAHDDLAAVAADLVARGVTRPDRIAAQGGSNGGLLIANMLTRHPEHFGALFCTVPLIDMRRYAKLLAGASWIAEFGDPDNVEDWSFLSEISAYHTVQAGRPYPPILLATTRRDDRVHPGHARKMAEKLRRLGCDVSFYESDAGGHGYGKDNEQNASFIALGLTFLRRAIGWDSL
ncbi:prolyl oligopeptidase family serine peptidase [Bradyrhizobium sp. CB3481]|uniref:prolyl oligopeptidase family serine peptidase n=1 Tax=Bradyrhizobium sp. CB3481 TaxID=3039158 RepID=UPI0024B08E72|nr:prolyl oligopeptidase family serine peptidase [Bradyrhizobium sp. CB3481]WFU14833.1 prolyl oligopeptidase family serine peptidase [Bradyrhizobium sp. CB3481]